MKPMWETTGIQSRLLKTYRSLDASVLSAADEVRSGDELGLLEREGRSALAFGTYTRTGLENALRAYGTLGKLEARGSWPPGRPVGPRGPFSAPHSAREPALRAALPRGGAPGDVSRRGGAAVRKQQAAGAVPRIPPACRTPVSPSTGSVRRCLSRSFRGSPCPERFFKFCCSWPGAWVPRRSSSALPPSMPPGFTPGTFASSTVGRRGASNRSWPTRA